jgi:site-specific DNA-cytosine methylase
MQLALSKTEARVIETHLRAAGTADGQRVVQWPGASSVYFAKSGRLWVHNDTPKRQAFQELYFHSIHSVAATLTASHRLKFWDLRRHASVRETARLQGLPDSFVLPRTRCNLLLGNAVTVPAAQHAISRVVTDKTSRITFVDMCSGLGAFRVAVQAVAPRARCVGYSEVFPAAIRCYDANFPDTCALGDATQVESWPLCELLIAGFPCTPWSSAVSNARRATHEKRDFYEVVLRAIRETRANRFVLENVPNIIRNGANRWPTLCETLQAWGFDLSYEILDSQDFGVPQARRRLYLVGRRDGMLPLPFYEGVTSPCNVTLKSILERDPHTNRPPAATCAGSSSL